MLNLDLTPLENMMQKFVSLPKTERECLKSLVKVKFFEKGTHLFQEGKVCKSLYFILTGGGRMYYIDTAGNEITYEFFLENMIVTAFASFIKQVPSSENIVLTEDSTVLSMSYEGYHYLLNKHPVWQTLSIELITTYLLKKRKREELLILDDYDMRYKKIFAMSPYLFQRFEQKHIASYLKMTPATLSRIKKRVYQFR